MVYSTAIELYSGEIKLSGNYYAPAETGIYPTICMCHGIPSGQPPEPGDGGYPELAERFCSEGYAVETFSFRGAGESEGNFDILGWTEDLATALDFLWEQPQVDRSRIILLGFSAGAAVSICVGARDANIAGVAACASPADFSMLIKDSKMTVENFRRIGIIRDKDFPESVEEWEENFKIVAPLYYVDKISPRPLLIVHGDGDDLVPIANAQRLFYKAGEPKQLEIIKGGGHRLRRDERAVKLILEWLQKYYS